MNTLLATWGLSLLCLAFPGWNPADATTAAPALGAPVASRLAPEVEEPPNVLFIVVDDLNDWVGVLGGHPQARTPNIDRLAARGMLFSNAHCPSPICVPSRTAVMTGMYPHVSGVVQNRGTLRQALPDAITLPELFRRAGYRATGTGKVFHYPEPDAWDDYYPFPEQPELTRQSLAPKAAHGYAELSQKTKLDWAAVDVPDARLRDAMYSAWAARQLAAESEEPFFLACGFSLPHLPWHVPAPYFEAFPLAELELPPTMPGDLEDLPKVARNIAGPETHELVLQSGAWRQAVQAYLAAVAFADQQVGVLLDALDGGPHADDTLVVLWSDHGLSLGEKSHWLKRSLWEESTRVPLILAGPGVQPGRCERAVGVIDLYRTLADVIGAEPAPTIGGHSLTPLLNDPAARRPAPVLTAYGDGGFAVRSDRWRYIRYANGAEELYDHAADPHEWNNLAVDSALDARKAELGAFVPDVPRKQPRKRKPRKEREPRER